jgi:hypothetical protein
VAQTPEVATDPAADTIVLADANNNVAVANNNDELVSDALVVPTNGSLGNLVVEW